MKGAISKPKFGYDMASSEIRGIAMATGFLSTHVLDTARGVPAAGIEILLYRVSGNSHKKIATMVTNDDGRTDSPILPAGKFKIGQYELIFKTGEYLRRNGLVEEEDLVFAVALSIMI